MPETNADFAKRMMLLARPASSFKPTAAYDRDGDCIEFLAAPDPFYAERVDDLVTVYYSQETGEVVGSLIKGVTSFLARMRDRLPGLRIVVQDGRVRMEHVFLVGLLASEKEPTDLATLTYRKLLDVAERADIETDMCLN